MMLVVTVLAYAGYAATVLTNREGDLADTPYVRAMVTAVVAAVVIQIVASIVLGSFRRDGVERDTRDLEIGRFGEHVGQSMVVIAGLAALILAMAEVEHFWIANTLFLGFFLSGLLDSMARLAAYREGLPRW